MPKQIQNRQTRGFLSNSADNTYQIGTGLGAPPSGYGALYDQLFANNPYRNLNYNKSAWQEFISMLGFRTDADRFQEEAQMNAAQTDFGIFQQIYQDRYNSELAKAQRMREAGENPDLLGTGDVSEASSPVEDPQGMTPGVSEEGIPGQVISTVISAFNSGIGMATQFLQLDGLRSDIEGKNISNAENMMNIIQQRVLGMTPAEGFSTDAEFQDWKRATERKLRFQYGQAFFKGASRRRWNRSIDDFIGGLPTSKEQFKEWKERLGDAKSYLSGRKDHWSEIVEIFDEVNKEIFELQNEITENSKVKEKTSLDVDLQTLENELQYQEQIEPGLRAEGQNATWRRQMEGEDFAGVLNKHLNTLGHRLDDISKNGGLKGFLAEVILLALTSKFNIGVDSKGNPSLSFDMPTAQ